MNSHQLLFKILDAIKIDEDGYTVPSIKQVQAWKKEADALQPSGEISDDQIELIDSGMCGVREFPIEFTRRVLALRQTSDVSGNQLRVRLRKFLDAAGGEGLVLDGVDAGELYFEVFPDIQGTQLRDKLRRVLQHHGCTIHGDGVLEADIIAIFAPQKGIEK